jgi:hypothetical protein
VLVYLLKVIFMSRKSNVLMLAAVAALGITLTATAGPVCEALLDNYTVKSVAVAQVDVYGRCVVMVTVNKGGTAVDEVRAVSDTKGDVKLFSDLGAVANFIKRSNLDSAALTTYKRQNKEVELGAPVAALKSAYKSFVVEKTASGKSKVAIAAEIVAATGLGYNTASGTPEAAEWIDLGKRLATVTEWNDYATAKVTALAAALTAAGIDPASLV